MATGEEIADCFGADDVSSLVTRPLKGAELSITHLRHDYEEGDAPVILPSDDAFLIVLYLVDVEHRDLYPDRPPAPLKRYTEGSICLISLDQGATIAICGRFEAILFHFPRRHLTELAEKAGEPLIKELAVCRGVKDQTIADLGAALLPILHAPSGGVDRQALPYICLAFSAHIAHRYGRPYHPH